MKTKLLLILIIVLAFILRFYKLNSLPALNADEAAIGYNAYSLIQTGKDEHGNSWPIHFQSFNDYKPGFYFYLVLPFIKVLGLNEWAVRLPGATLGVLSILVIFLLTKELFNKDRVALFSSLFLAISPWHIHFSRGGWEVNTATFFITLGLYLFIKYFSKGRFYLLLFGLFYWLAALYSYHAARIVIPLLGLALLVIKRKFLLTNFKQLVIAGVIGLLLLLPLAIDLTKPAAISRAAGVGLFADSGPLNRINEQRGEHINFQSKTSRLFHNKVVNYVLAFGQNWTDHFHGEFLFLSGDDIQRNKVPETGVLYLFDLLLLTVGLVAVARKPQGWGVVIVWLLVAPIASALTFQSPHALRAHNMVVPITIINAYGLVSLIELIRSVIRNNRTAKILIGIFSLFMLWNLSRYLHEYYTHMVKEYPFSSQYGVKELVSYVKDNEQRFEKVIVTNRYDQPYILFLYYLQYSPVKFQAEHVLTAKGQYGFSTVNNFNKYYFTDIRFDSVKPENPNSLIVGTDSDIPIEANIIKVINFPNGEIAFKIVAN